VALREIRLRIADPSKRGGHIEIGGSGMSQHASSESTLCFHHPPATAERNRTGRAARRYGLGGKRRPSLFLHPVRTGVDDTSDLYDRPTQRSE
jgi:hypothetical protein